MIGFLVEKFLLVLLIGVLLALIGLFAYLIIPPIFRAVDSWNLTEYDGIGVIEQKKYSPASTVPVTTKVGDVMVTNNVPVPESWHLTISMSDDSDSVSVTKDFWDEHKPGNEVRISFVRGRFTDKFYIKQVYRD